MLRIDVGPIWSSIVGYGVPYKDIDNACSYFLKAALNSPKYKGNGGYWDGKVHLYKNGTFPTGLWFKVKEVLESQGIPYNINSQIVWDAPRWSWKLSDHITPYPDQIRALEASTACKRGILKCPTGFGKTAVLASSMIAAFGVPTLFIANQNILINQAKEAFERNIVGHDGIGVISDGVLDIKTITVASIQSLWSRRRDERVIKLLRETVKLVIVDECQAVGTDMWKGIMGMVEAPYRFGLSATPSRGDGADLEIHAATGRVIFEASAADMIEKGRLADVDISFVEFDHGLYNENDSGIPYSDAYESWIINNHERNELAIKSCLQLLSEGRHILLLITRIEHGEILRGFLNSRGVQDVEFIWGQTKDKIRDEALRDFKEGKFRVLIGSTIFDVGVDIPIASGLVLAGAGSSKERAPQRVGRVIRLFGNNKVAKVVDILDKNVKFFKQQAYARRKIYIEEFGAERVHVLKAADKTTPVDKNIEEKRNKIESKYKGIQTLDQLKGLLK